ncbi:hypothetical protein [Massilia sp. CCM 8734]|uniref:hypothetical protein n=1 Tax=Massilia sp. CCM 8734 TaxID=2609283 RepID=UPI0014215E64|nr:hypothetical protein [Massilia sp. CCM 8734]NHZ99587.1 hypothetical protein [Massilia sp. CCM 8734]
MTARSLVSHAFAALVLGVAGSSAAAADTALVLDAVCQRQMPPLQRIAVARAFEAAGGTALEVCIQGSIPDPDPALWEAIVSMLGSEDHLARRSALRLLRWSRDADVEAQHAIVLPLLHAMLRDPGARPYRHRVQEEMLRYRKRALFALPDFMDAAMRAQDAQSQGAAMSVFLELGREHPAQIDLLVTVLDSPTVSPYAKGLVANYMSATTIAGSNRAIPSLQRLIEHTTHYGADPTGDLVGAYIRAEEGGRAAAYLMALRSRNVVPGLDTAIDYEGDMHGMDDHLIGLLDHPAMSVAAAATLQGRFRMGRLTAVLERQAGDELRSQMASPATRAMAMASIRALQRPLDGVAPMIMAYYRSLPQAQAGERRNALKTLSFSGGADQQHLAYLVTELMRELRAGYPAGAGQVPPAAILAVLKPATAMPASSVPELVDAFKLAHRPGKQFWWNDMVPFTNEQGTILALLGKTRSSAGAAALAALLPRFEEGDREHNLATSLDYIGAALIESGDAALPVLEWQLRNRSGIAQAYAEAVLARIDTPAAKDATSRHAAQVGPALVAALASGGSGMVDAPWRLPSQYLDARGSAFGLAIARVGNLKLGTTVATLDALARALDDGEFDIKEAAATALDMAPERDMVREAVFRIAALGARPRASEMAKRLTVIPPYDRGPTCQ